MSKNVTSEQETVAIVGVAGRFPGAASVEALWHNLIAGRESISHFSEASIAASDYALGEVQDDPSFVKARGVLDDISLFDAGFFGFRPREAASLDPQHRVWFETAWHALEDAGIAPDKFDGRIGVFAGSGYLNTYLMHNLAQDRDFVERLVRLRALDAFQNIISNDKDFLPTRTSYLFDLRGPSVNVQTACSTSLVAIVQGIQSLLQGDCDACIAGGISIQLPQIRGYLTQDGGMESSDGHVRAFDEKADGTVFSNGVGAVVLKRLRDALRDNDRILATVPGYAINNDGAGKGSYTAPSPAGQEDVIAQAVETANIDPQTISYVEAHGTGTSLGDPVEVSALSNVFRRYTDRTQFCAIGSVKSNLGHLDSAAGVAGLAKILLALRHEKIPPTINFDKPNPKIDFPNTAFFVADKTIPWPRNESPRRAALSSFGVGGTNAHVVVEEAPQQPAASPSTPWQLLCLSAKDENALAIQAQNLAEHLENEDLELGDVAYSLATGRADMPYRRFIVAEDKSSAVESLRTNQSVVRKPESSPPDLIFLLPGQGSQHLGMGRGLYGTEPEYKAAFDECLRILKELWTIDSRKLLLDADPNDEAAAALLTRTDTAQPLLFAIEYAIAQLWRSKGVTPSAMIGHSLGEFTAACLAGVFSLEDTLSLLVSRGKFMQAQPPGDMLAIRAPAADVTKLLAQGCEISAINTENMTVVSGDRNAMNRMVENCEAANVRNTKLHTSHAFHSAMMEGALEKFSEAVSMASKFPPEIPTISSSSGTWLTPEEAVSDEYWVQQLRQPVRFLDGMRTTMAEFANRLYLEVGPGNTLATLGSQCGQKDDRNPVVTTLGHPLDEMHDRSALLTAAGQLWAADYPLAWREFFDKDRQRVSLPLYPFQRKHYWVDPPNSSHAPEGSVSPLHTQAPVPAPESETVMNAESRLTKIETALAQMLEEVSGEDIDAEEPLTFVEMGFDSLFLTQVATEVQNRFKHKLRFRRMLEDLNTITSLAAYLDDVLGPEFFPAENVTPDAPTPAAGETPLTMQPLPALSPIPGIPVAPGGIGPNTGVQTLVEQQLALMQQQLLLLQGIPATLPTQETANRATAVHAPAKTGSQTKSSERTDHSVAPEEHETPAGKPKSFGAQAKITTDADASLAPDQLAALNDFTARYNAKTQKSKEFTERHREVMADPRVVTGFNPIWKELVYPIVVDRSAGAHLWDIDGNKYVDLTCGFGSNFLGNQPDFIKAALREQIDAGYEVGPQHPLTADVSNMIAQLTGMERVAFCNTGSEAVMGAMRQARTVTGRKLIAIFKDSYHGIFDEVIVRGNKKYRATPAAPGILREAVDNVLVLEYGSDEALNVARERGAELAAIMVEPVQSRNPKLQPQEFLQQVRQIATESDCALIFDEVITGFRISPGGAQEYFGVRADIATYGKIIGGGLPFAAIAGNRKYMDALDGGQWQFGDDSYPEQGVTYFAGTFVRHPLALAAAKASLEHLIEQGPTLQENLNKRASRMVEELRTIFSESGARMRMDQFGSLCRLTVSEEEPFGALLYYWLRDRGIHIWEGFGLFLTTAHSDDDVEFIIRAFRDSISDLQGSGLLGSASPDSAEHSQDQKGGDHQPLTEAQQEIWLTSHMSPEASCSYNESFTLDISGALDVRRFDEAVRFVTSRHDALRLRFSESGESQYLGDPNIDSVAYIDWSKEDAGAIDELKAAMLSEAASLPFDLANGPLVRNALYKLSDSEHIFVSTAHHIVFDGWSAGVYVEEIGLSYSAFVAGKKPSLPPATSYVNYVTREQEAADGAEGRAALDYWKNVYSSFPEPLDLPSKGQRPLVRSYGASSIHWEFKDENYAALKAFAASNNSTLFSVMLAAYGVLLHKLSGIDDLVVGIPTAGQAREGEYSLIGHCVNILPIRVKPESSQRVLTYLADVHRANLDGQDAQPATLGSIVRATSAERIPGRSTLVETIFNLNRKLPDDSFDELQVAINEVQKRAINWDLFFNCSEEHGGLLVDCDYNTDLFTDEMIRAWLETFETIIETMVANPDILIRELPSFSSEARKQLDAWSRGTSCDVPEGGLFDLVRSSAERNPNDIACRCGDQVLTYSDLIAQAEAIARNLQQNGGSAGAAIGVCLPRTTQMLPALLGALAAGCHYVPIDREYPSERIAYMLNDAAAKFAICNDETADSIGDWAGTRLSIDDLLSGISALGPLPAVQSSDLAYVIYTSGSTGAPKGVEISHGALLNLLTGMQELDGIADGDSCLAATSVSFDISGLELFLPLILGQTVVLADDAAFEDPEQLIATIQSAKPSLIQATPTVWQLLCDGGWKIDHPVTALVGGEALSPALAERLAERCSRVYNMYGPTETTIWSTYWRVGKTVDEVLIGKPIANTQVYVLDDQLKPVPPGTTGELFIGGRGLASGYRGNPELTGERFVTANVFGEPRQLYKTGDLCYWTLNGELSFVTRSDDQVKVRGHRIELGEIECVLSEAPNVKASAAKVWQREVDDVRIIGYYVADTELESNELLQNLRRKLPDFMVPQHLIRVSALPRLPSGKLDRGALPLPDSANPSTDSEAWSELEDRVAEVWRSVLGNRPTSREQTFFEAGGHSILAVRLLSALREAMEPRLGLRQIFEYPTVARMAAEIDKISLISKVAQGNNLSTEEREEIAF